ncbi:MAG: hypothetical protein MUO64_14010 [Anaerolineales bacterium]|nr:hypothetical protein [Anaerolineales bacterium]
MDTKTVQSTLQGPISQQLYLAFELSQKQWKLGFTIGVGQRPRMRTIQVRDLPVVGCVADAPKFSCRCPIF